MLKLKKIRKVYSSGGDAVIALKDISLAFRKSEFVSVLGQSGCGKTTLLNIIGGLDHYTSGDLVIEGRSTKHYTDHDWDKYRNHSIGFVFQSYNLIPHQSVLSNVELALTVSGENRATRRKRAIDALEKVGLGDQLRKKPNQMSGGQMQRVAIARALVNNPEILLADEPTGALDSATSVQIMDLLREIAKDRLVIMVTHNPELAEKYSTRIIRLLDGNVVSDSAPYTEEEEGNDLPRKKNKFVKVFKDLLSGYPIPSPKRHKKRYASMSFFSALSLSLQNLMTKKARTFLTSFAGSIGIIGIALILSVSTGVQNYIDAVQRDTLSSYPISISAEQTDFSSLISTFMGKSGEEDDGMASHPLDKVYANSVLYEMMNSINQIEIEKNNLRSFKSFLDNDEEIKNYISAVHYDFGADMTFYTKDSEGKIIRADLTEMMNASGGNAGNMMSSQSTNPFISGFSSIGVMEEMLPGEDGSLVHPLLTEQYDLLYGHWPESYDEMVLVVNQNNEVSDMALYALGLKSSDEFTEAIKAYILGKEIVTESGESWTYEEICNHEYKLITKPETYAKNENGGYNDLTKNDAGLSYVYANAGISVRISGIIRKNSDAVAGMMSGVVGYTSALSEYLIQTILNSEIVKEQLSCPETDVLTGLPFKTDESDTLTESDKATKAANYLSVLTDSERAALYRTLKSTPTEKQLDELIDSTIGDKTRAEITDEYLDAYIESIGASPETVKNYINSMSDEEFFALIRSVLREQIREKYMETVTAQMAKIPDNMALMGFANELKSYTDADYAVIYDNYMPSEFSDSDYETVIDTLGIVNADTPVQIEIFAKSFEDKDAIADCITRYNNSVTDESDTISYTDYVALIMSSISTIINAISYVLIAFVAISLVVSSIMIGIITHISVLERTKEIGVLRAIGASKRDVSRVFNAETLIVGFIAGALGIIVSLLLLIPINAILHHLTGIGSLSAVIPVEASVVLVLISMGLTLFAGIFPARSAAKKDPVLALRSE